MSKAPPWLKPFLFILFIFLIFILQNNKNRNYVYVLRATRAMILQLANNERLQYAISDVGFGLLSHVLFFFLRVLECFRGTFSVLEYWLNLN